MKLYIAILFKIGKGCISKKNSKKRKKGDKYKEGKKQEEFWIFKQILNQCGENLKNALIKCEVEPV